MSRMFSFDHLPENEAELHAQTSFEYIYLNPAVIKKPQLSAKTKENNRLNLFRLTSEYFNQNLNRLLYEAKIFNG